MKPSISDKLQICKDTRKIASESLANVLKDALLSKSKISEADFANKWLGQLRKNKEIFPEGWYIPPPHGMGVLFATETNFDRISFKSLRDKKYWPKKNVFLNRQKGYLNFYYSPVSKNDYIIGDFGLTVYLGKQERIKKHLRNSLKVIKKVYDEAKLDMKLKDFYQISKDIFLENNVVNNWWVSINDPTGINTGHSIPSTFGNWLTKETKIFNEGDWNKIAQTISKKRIFVNSVEKTKIAKNCAFTIEPRLKSKKDKNLPIAFYHTIVLFKSNGQKELLTGFENIFKLAKMDYILK